MVFFAGATLSSYAGVVAERGWKGSTEGRSVCRCGRELTGKDLVPVLSWTFQGGKARCCGSRIPVRYIATEGLCGALCVATVFLLGPVGAVAVPAALPLTLLLNR